jgi:hypothetical protein
MSRESRVGSVQSGAWSLTVKTVEYEIYWNACDRYLIAMETNYETSFVRRRRARSIFSI